MPLRAPAPLPPLLEHAAQRVRQAVRSAVERTVESLGLASLAATNAFQRDAILNAQFEVNRKSALFHQTFEAAFDEQLRREALPRADIPLGEDTGSWEDLSLVENHELEIKVQAERFGLEITHACEWELRELEAYVGSILGHARAERDRNPLRPEIIGNAMIRGVEAVVDRPDVRKLLAAELGRSLAAVLRATYAEIVADLRKAGVQPVSLSVRTSEDRGDTTRAAGFDSHPRDAQRSGHGGLHDAQRSGHGALRDAPGSGWGSARDGRHTGSGGFDARSASGYGRGGQPTGSGTLMGHVEPGMMDLLRRLSVAELPAGGSGGAAWHDADRAGFGSGGSDFPNLIQTHREELRQASRGALDHMVIDIIAGLFDQILSDPKVPPQLARQIARLQLPVLRAALGDSSFFSSRRHPVRRFVNRIASLGAAFDDFSEGSAQSFLAKVRDLVHEVVEGEFDQIEIYETKLAALEAHAAELAREDVAARGEAEALLARKEDEIRLQAHYAQRLHGELQTLAAPEFVRDFVAQVWSQVLLKAAEKDGAQGALVKKLRDAGRELFMSVQPKTSPVQRKAFIAELPKLMQSLNDGMDLIGWPEAAKRAFFGQLLPAHAEALKAQTVRTLDFNMLARQVEQVLDRAPPQKADLPPAAAQPLGAAAALPAPKFSAEEAARIGFVDESAVDWNGKVDIDLGAAEPDIGTVDLELPGVPAPTEAAEPVQGRSLADHVQIGFSYQMHIEGDWQKVRLAHISPGRAFFVFIHGQRHERTISLTQRMLVKMCESGRMRAFESAYLIERATARARRQLAALGGGARRAP